ncbi:hypothetical protein R3P38DRAFT_3195882 [Favolaschia claudopus]|uniref:Uncharacterized protein n=1 Tax=Favolaschia claudopus TaxID=2862362 RepID=A0AAW0BA43_9AGAR
MSHNNTPYCLPPIHDPPLHPANFRATVPCYLVTAPRAQHPGRGVYYNWQTAQRVSEGVPRGGAKKFACFEDTLTAWHSCCEAGEHTHSQAQPTATSTPQPPAAGTRTPQPPTAGTRTPRPAAAAAAAATAAHLPAQPLSTPPRSRARSQVGTPTRPRLQGLRVAAPAVAPASPAPSVVPPSPAPPSI